MAGRIAVSRVDRPAAAPVGVFDYGFKAVNHPGFVAGMTASNVSDMVNILGFFVDKS
jgi:hypothetical protein